MNKKKRKRKYFPTQNETEDLPKEEWEKWNIEYFGSDNYLPLDESDEDDDTAEELNFDH